MPSGRLPGAETLAGIGSDPCTLRAHAIERTAERQPGGVAAPRAVAALAPFDRAAQGSP